MMISRFTLSVVLSVMAVGTAAAQDNACSALLAQGCACAAPIVPGQAPGVLTGIEGSVAISGPANFTPVTVPAPLTVGSGLIIGPDGKASISFGPSCQHVVVPGSATVSV